MQIYTEIFIGTIQSVVTFSSVYEWFNHNYLSGNILQFVKHLLKKIINNYN
jgi:hypothetical protein